MNTPYRLLSLAALGAVLATAATAQTTATGTVFHDRNSNGRKDANEKGIPNVRVSNQRDVTTTDQDGKYRLPVTDDTILFVVKPKGWKTPYTEDNLPRFYYIHKPKGSPKQRFPGVAPTGPLPASVDFPLTPAKEPKKFQAIFMGDTQVGSQATIDIYAHDVVEELIGTDASFGLILGDNAGDNLAMHRPLNQASGRIGIPMYNVPGNHDENYDSVDDTYATESFQSVYGPAYYSFEVGPVHFVVLDDVKWDASKGAANGTYTSGLGPKQMEWLRNDLALVPKNQLVVLTMHIPINQIAEKAEIFRLLEPRPNTLSVSGHTHTQAHRFLGKEDGWNGAEPHHHLVSTTACGTWWGGTQDEYGIPHTLQRDGTPNGYNVMTFDGNRYSVRFKAARKPDTHQMSLFAPEEVAAAETGTAEVLANIFAGSDRSTVEMRIDNKGPWTRMEKTATIDPYYDRLQKLGEQPNAGPGAKLPGAGNSTHIWKAALPASLAAGTHVIQVRTTDMFGQKDTGYRLIRVK